MKFLRVISDAIKFRSTPTDNREIIFYSEGRNYWPYLNSLLFKLLETESCSVCYISSDTQDPGLQFNHPKLTHFLLDSSHIRDWFFANLDYGVIVMTMPDLGQYQIKKSSSDKVHYVYVQHALMSLHMAYRPGAFNYYDTIFCCGPHHVNEVREIEKYYNLKNKINTVEHGYSIIDKLLKEKQKWQVSEKQVLIAPSWGEQALIESGTAIQVIEQLIQANYEVVLRPHPETRKHSQNKINEIIIKFKSSPLFSYENDITTQHSFFTSSMMVSDWSGAAIEYALGLNKPIIYINLPKKVNNHEHDKIAVEPFEVTIRDKIGVVTDAQDLLSAIDQVFSSKIDTSKYIFNKGNSDQAGVDALLNIRAELINEK